MVLTVGKDVGEHFHGAGCISKYGNISKNSQKIAERIRENWGMVLTVGDDIFRVQCTFPNMESEAVLNVK